MFLYVYLLTIHLPTQVSITIDMTMDDVELVIGSLTKHHKLNHYHFDTREVAIEAGEKWIRSIGKKPRMDCIESQLRKFVDNSYTPFC